MKDNPSNKQVVWELILLSFVSMYVEMLIIRWMSTDIRVFTVFRTFPLIACFVGLGVGFALRKDNAYKLFLPATFFFALCMKVADISGVAFWTFPSLSVFNWQASYEVAPGYLFLLLLALVVVLLLAGPFTMCVAIGSRLGVLFNQLPALPAYCYNIVGSIVGCVTLPLLSYFGCAPWQLLLAIATVVVGIRFRQTARNQNAINFGLLAVILLLLILTPQVPARAIAPELLPTSISRRTIWSPYQKLDLTTFFEKSASPSPGTASRAEQSAASGAGGDNSKESGPFLGLDIGTNRNFYQFFYSQYAINTSKLSQWSLLQGLKKDYPLAFILNHPKSALIVGAGSGQNVAAAVGAKLEDIDAVEIDPAIIAIGKQFNTDYHDSHVHSICDDARHYFLHCGKKYDVIDFSCLDSQTVAGLGSSVRVDCYVYTKESIESALSLLNDNGIILCSFNTMAPWTKERLYAAFKEAAGYPPLCVRGKLMETIYILGNAVKNGTLANHPALADYVKEEFAGNAKRMLTDDWPYLYVRPDVVDYPYLLVVAEIVALSLFVTRRFVFSNKDLLNWQMFFLGASFMTLELHAIAFLSLLYGSTWITSAIVINGVLIMILAANAVVIKCDSFLAKHPHLPYIALLLSVLIDYLLPNEQVLAMKSMGSLVLTFFHHPADGSGWYRFFQCV